ncbi:hypothetical protein TI39_contig327g00002 [Zymoseptoria brevis]|uniref:Methyltransferase type 12 domain-containing protein n=1 Tax=Zymoseptoria brevis TaxID=1047168 RepID=A0A0F4GSU7_9PEZI|nr:hypothetical protein TI39_contig327g00002 [Zymoseptoria brevis]
MLALSYEVVEMWTLPYQRIVSPLPARTHLNSRPYILIVSTARGAATSVLARSTQIEGYPTDLDQAILDANAYPPNTMSSSNRPRITLLATAACLFIFVTLWRHVPAPPTTQQEAAAEQQAAAEIVPNVAMKAEKAAKDVFSHIYETNYWGGEKDRGELNSGPGSHDEKVVAPYVEAVRKWIEKKYEDKNVHALDLGCGDFNVGRQIRNVTTNYTGADVVPIVIEHNKKEFGDAKTDFQVVDMIEDPLPKADVVFIRQVLQHLSNGQIAKVLPKLRQFQWAVISEHLPHTDDFTPNRDIETGQVRFMFGSGTDLTAEPFNMRYTKKEVVLEVIDGNGRIRTTAYYFAQ